MTVRFRGFDRFDVALIATTVLSFAAVAVLPVRPNKFGDLNFHNETRLIAAALRGAGSWSAVVIEKAPGPDLYYLLPYALVTPSAPDHAFWQAGFIWTVAWMAVCALLLRRTGEMIGGRTAGLLTPFLALAAPFGVYYSYGINAEPAAFLGTTLFLYGWARWQAERPRGIPVACAGLILFVLSRPNGLLIVPVALGAAVMIAWKEKRRVREVRFAATVAAASTVAVIAASLAVSRINGARQTPYLAHVAFHGSFQYRHEPLDWRFWDSDTRGGSADYSAWLTELAKLKQAARDSQVPLSSLQWKWITNDMVEHPVLRLRAAAVRAVTLHTPFVSSGRPERFTVGAVSGRLVFGTFQGATILLNLLLVGAAFWALASRRPDFFVRWPLWAPWMALIAFHAPLYAEARYLLPAQPGILLLASMAIAPSVTRFSARLSRPAGSRQANVGA